MVILGAEIAMLLIGLIVLIQGRISLAKNCVVLGVPARLIGMVLMLPFPLATAFINGFYLLTVVVTGHTPTPQMKWVIGAAHMAAITLGLLGMFWLAARNAQRPAGMSSSVDPESGTE